MSVPYDGYREYLLEERKRRAAAFFATKQRRRRVRAFPDRAVPREIIEDWLR